MVFLDFDNTITCVDVLDAVIERFSVNQEWVAHEEAWKAGEIGSRECLEAQLRSVRVTKKDLAEYVQGLSLDPFFGRLLGLLKKRNIPCLIVSDSFSFIIKTLLDDQGIRNIKVLANELHFEKGGRLIPAFPHVSKDCLRCAHCKKKHILEHQDRFTIYVGDGLSDVCPALHADLVFAKGALLDRLRESNKSCNEFSDLNGVCAFFEDFKSTQRKSKKVLALTP